MPTAITAIPTARYPGVELFCFWAGVSESQLRRAVIKLNQPNNLCQPCQYDSGAGYIGICRYHLFLVNIAAIGMVLVNVPVL
jgi:hypothetical protein